MFKKIEGRLALGCCGGKHQYLGKQKRRTWERFTDEMITDQRGNRIHRQSDKASRTVLDKRTKQGMIRQRLIKSVEMISVTPGPELSELDEELQKETNQDNIQITDSWETAPSFPSVSLVLPLIPVALQVKNGVHHASRKYHN